MASEGGKIKPKRKQAPSKPYDRNLTLFGKLRKSVKDLLVPSWMLTSQQQNERHATVEACEPPEASSATPMESSIRAGDGIATLNQTPLFVDSTKDQREQHLISGHSKGTNVFIGEPYIGLRHSGKVSVGYVDSERQDWDLVSDKQDQDTTCTPKLSGSHYSQEFKQMRVDPMRARVSDSYLNDTDDQNTEMTGAHHIMTSTRVQNQSLDISQTVAKRQRLWSPESRTQGINLLSPVKEKPAFNPVLLGSMNDSAVFGDSFNKSLFYPGKTRFGGASAERRTSLNTSLPYQSSLPLRKQVKAHNASNNFQATTSATAQRILETLDKMSTPLGDARKIPVASTSTNDSVLLFTPSSYRQASFDKGRPLTRPLQLPARGPPTSQHQALAQAVIAKNRYRSGVVDRRAKSMMADDDVDDRTMPQEPARLVEMVRPAVSCETRVSSAAQQGGKMKVKRFSQHISNTGANDGQVTEAPNLRTDFTLPVSSMVPISLQSYPVRSHTAAESSIPSSDVPVPLKFIFSAPIDVDEKRQTHCQISDTTDKNFKFTSPIKTSQTKTSAVGAEGGSKTCQEPAVGASSGMPLWTPSAAFTASVPAWGSTAPKPKVSSPDIGGTSSSFKSYSKWGSFEKPDDSSAASDTSGGFSLAPAASLKSGSVMDILGGKSSAPANDDLMAKFKKPAGSWECESCMIVNKPEATKCVCCDTTRPGSKQMQACSPIEPISKPSMTTTFSGSSGESSKSQSGTSGYDASTMSNKLEAGKSIAPETLKPGIKQPLNGTGIGSENSLSALFKKPVGAWECDTCMVQNKAGAVRCIACDSSKPGLQVAGIVSKAPVSSSSSSAIIMSPAGGFTVISAMTTTTSGSGGFKFGNANTSSSSSTSVPSATGFKFGQTISSNKDSSINSSTGSSSSTPLTGGFKFGTTTPEGDSGGTASVTSGFGVASSGSGFTFGNNSSNANTVLTSDSIQGFQMTGETVNFLKPDAPASKSSSCVTVATGGQSDVGSNGTTDFSKSNSFVNPSAAIFRFGSTNTTSLTTLSGNPQSGTQLNSNDNNSKLPHKEVNLNFVPASTAPPSFMPTTSQPSEKPDCPAKPAGTLFQFGNSSVAPVASSGLGMGKSLSDSKPMINGGFGSCFEVTTVKADSKAVSVDSNKSFGNFTFSTTPAVFGDFGQASGPPAELAVAQPSQSSKRSVDLSESDQPTAKKSFNFGAGASDHSSNGLFAFPGSSELKASPFVINSAGPSTGGFKYNSNPLATQTAGPAPDGGFQFPLGSSAPQALQGIHIFKAPIEGSKPSFEAAPYTGPVSFSTTPNFNFSTIQQQASSVFQFGAKSVESVAPAPGVFTFGTTHPSNATFEGSGFGTPGVGPVGNFSIGASDTGRKMKKGVRRIKK